MRILPIIEHLKANVPLLEGRVEAATSTMGLNESEQIDSVPFCFVHSFEESPKSPEVIGSPEQEGSEKFRLILMAETLDETASSEPVEDVRGQIRDALKNWQMTEEHSTAEFMKGNVLDINGRIIVWADIYQVPRCWY